MKTFIWKIYVVSRNAGKFLTGEERKMENFRVQQYASCLVLDEKKEKEKDCLLRRENGP